MAEKELIEPMIFDEPKKPEQKELINPMQFDVREKSHEEKMYIILYKINDDDIEDYQENIYAICIGRTEAYNDIKNKLVSGLSVDVHRSIIITETKQKEASTGDGKYFLLPLDECMSVYAFCIAVGQFFDLDEFNIEDYNNTDVPEDEKKPMIPLKLTKEQEDYQKMLYASIERDKFLNALHAELDGKNV